MTSIHAGDPSMKRKKMPQFFRNRLWYGCVVALFLLSTGMFLALSRTTAHAASLPAPWADGDVGNVGVAGSASFDNGTYSVTSSGIIEYTYDKFHFVYQHLYGDGTITARVTGLTGGNSNAKAGIMIRNDLNGYPAGINALVDLRATGEILFQRRLTAGEVTNYTGLSGSFAAPYWLKLARQGSTLTASASPDGQQWTEVGSDTLTNLTVDAWVGLAVGSGSDSETSTATFDNVSISQPDVNVSVDWNNVKGPISPLAYGVNGYSALDVNVMPDANFTTAITSMNAGLIRLHYAGLLADSGSDSRGWVSNANKTWDAARIKFIMDGIDGWKARGYNPTVVVNIPGFPSWLSTYNITDPNNGNEVVTENLLRPDQFDAYASFCAQLVKILNVDQNRGIKYFEVPNEADDAYNRRFVDYNKQHGTNFADKMDELATLYNKVAVAMKAVDSSILMGGPSLERPDLINGVTTFINNTVNQSNPTTIDFFSGHAYASGNKNDSDLAIYNRVYTPGNNKGTMSADLINVRNALDAASSGRTIPFWVDEINISYTYTNDDSRMRTNKGVVFDALWLAYFLSNGVDVTASWNDADGIYGKIDPYSSPAYQLRPGGQFLKLMNSYAIGDRVASSTDKEDTIVPFAVKTSSGFTYILINRSPNQRQVASSFSGGPDVNGSFTQYQFSDSGQATQTVNGIQSVSLPPFSVTLLTTSQAGSSWIKCADENGTCNFPGTRQVRYGADGQYFYQTATDSIGCNNGVFGDPIVGTYKACYYR